MATPSAICSHFSCYCCSSVHIIELSSFAHMTQRLSCVLLLLLLLFTHQASSSTPPTRLPSTYYDNTDKNRKHTPSNSATDGSGSNKKIPPRSQPSAVTFLYELYEHEIYNPSTDSWTSRRFTQSPITGGGGRDSTSRKYIICELNNDCRTKSFVPSLLNCQAKQHAYFLCSLLFLS